MSLTLAFELAALRRLENPEDAVIEARQWSENVGIVTDRPPHVLTKFTRDNHIRNDFQPAVEPAVETLTHLVEHFNTDRFVFIAASADDAPDDWVYRSVEAAAERANWLLASETSPTDSSSITRQRDDWP